MGIFDRFIARYYSALNPVIQVSNRFSPSLVPLVTMVVSASYVSDDPISPNPFWTSMFTVPCVV